MSGLLLVLVLACGGDAPNQGTAAAQAEDPGLSECAVCGMVVREQPAPRGQVLRRSGVREHACSLGDLRALLAVPSPHGKVEQAWVEVLPADATLDQLGHEPHPWAPAETAHYVAGVERPHVMGAPILSYASAGEADAAAARLGGYRTSWQSLNDTPFAEAPQPTSP